MNYALPWALNFVYISEQRQHQNMKRRLDSTGSSLNTSFGGSRDDLSCSSCHSSSNNSFNSSESNSCEPSSCKHSRRRHSEDAGRTLKVVPVSFNGLLVSTETEAERLDRLLEEQVDCPTNNNNGICMEVAIPDGRYR